ncbi:Arginine--pyruvate transaminase AruH [compost metagenome]|jgi:hypothetical protein|nr:hypothetical protein PS647_04001 [Pseudomonas fluorescens]
MLVQALLDLGDEVIGTCGAKVVPVAERLENSFQVASVDVVALITPPPDQCHFAQKSEQCFRRQFSAEGLAGTGLASL